MCGIQRYKERTLTIVNMLDWSRGWAFVLHANEASSSLASSTKFYDKKRRKKKTS